MVKVPGSCGELAQGRINGKNILITCPVNWYSSVDTLAAEPESAARIEHCKSYRAVELLFEKYGYTHPLTLKIESSLPRGKGMASSSADIAASCAAAAKLMGKTLDVTDIKDIALAIEPTDGIFFPGVVAFEYLTGNSCLYLGKPPPMRLAVFDFGGEVDTLSFNSRIDLADFTHEKQLDFQEAYELIKEGVAAANPVLIGKGATISALANQKILHKPHLEKFIIEGNKYGALGVNVAHSGTVAGVMFDMDILEGYEDCVKSILRLCPGITYLGSAELISGGIFDKE